MTSASPGTASGWDWTRLDFQERLYDIYRELRDRQPLARSPSGFWAVSRFSDVFAIASDALTYSSERTVFSPPGMLPTIQSLDPPRHDRLRALVSLAFTPSRVRAMEPRVRAIARELLDALWERGSGDLLAHYARQIPSRVIGEMIGIPAERRADFLRWSEALVTLPGDGDGDAVRDPSGAIYQEFAALLDARRRERRDDLMSALIDAVVEGRRLTQEELLGFCFVLVVAGNDTTTNLIANGAVLLAEHPEQRRLLVQDPALLPNAIEEMLRCETPAQALPRRVTRAVELYGETLPEGAPLFLLWGAANRDEREFAAADRFDVRRPIKRHLAFGQGVHFCLGKSLARLEAVVAFEELLALAPEYVLTGPAPWLPSMWARAHARVPVALRV